MEYVFMCTLKVILFFQFCFVMVFVLEHKFKRKKHGFLNVRYDGKKKGKTLITPGGWSEI